MSIDPKVLKLIQEIEEPEYSFKKQAALRAGGTTGALAGLGTAVGTGLAQYGAFSWPALAATSIGGIAGTVLTQKILDRKNKKKELDSHVDSIPVS
jgi:hypothetical protein